MENFLGIEFWGNTLYNYIIAISIGIIVYTISLFFRKYITKQAKHLKNNEEYKRRNLLIKDIAALSKLFYIVLRIYIPVQWLQLNPIVNRIVEIGFLTIITRELANIVISMIKYILEESFQENHNGKKDTTKINLFSIIAKILIYVIGGLFLLSNAGIKITPLIASLGVAGIAVAFALQKILGDVFASFSIFLDRPFEIGDFVTIGEDNGHIKDIGIKSTRIQTLHGQELIIPNSEIIGTRINNYGKMTQRRVVFSINIVYHTDPELVEKIPQIIQTIIENTANTEFDRAHFTELGKSELIFEIVYHITDNDFKLYKDTHQIINLNIMKEFKKQGIQFAYPTQSIYIEQTK